MKRVFALLAFGGASERCRGSFLSESLAGVHAATSSVAGHSSRLSSMSGIQQPASHWVQVVSPSAHAVRWQPAVQAAGRSQNAPQRAMTQPFQKSSRCTFQVPKPGASSDKSMLVEPRRFQLFVAWKIGSVCVCRSLPQEPPVLP